MIERLAICLALVAALGTAGRAAEGPKKAGVAKLPHLRLDLKTKTVELDGIFLVAAEYPLELLVCRNDVRDYESIISTRCAPSTLHTALLALGLKPRVRDKKDLGKIVREGDPVDLQFRYVQDGKKVTIRPHTFMIDVATKKHLRPLPWVFYGSYFFPSPEEEKKLIYLGDAESWVIGLLGNIPSVVDVGRGMILRYGDLEIDKALVPPKGTKVTIVIRPAGARKMAPPAEAPVPPAPK